MKSRLQSLLAGHAKSVPFYGTTLLLRIGLGLMYGLTFYSLLFDMAGLYGSKGIIPLDQFYTEAYRQDGYLAFLKLPSIFWICGTDGFLTIFPWVGLVVSIALVLNILPVWSALLSWVLLLSFTVGHNFFIWDLLLLEAGLLLILLLYTTRKNKGQAPRLLVFAFRLLVFRLWFSMGVTKIYLSDPAWYDLSFMQYFWHGQPMPTPFAWYAAQLGPFSQGLMTLLTLVLEIVVPLFIFSKNRKLRLLAFIDLSILCVLIHLSGNYATFLMMTLVLNIVILPEQVWQRLLTRFRLSISNQPSMIELPDFKGFAYYLCMLLVGLQLMYLGHLAIPSVYSVNVYNVPFANRFSKQAEDVVPGLKWALVPLKMTAWARLSSPYGVFRFIVYDRDEIEIEASVDSVNWRPYVFKYKSTQASPASFFAPHFPRLDHWMYYEAQAHRAYLYDDLYGYHNRNNDWFRHFVHQMAVNEPDVIQLLAGHPINGAQPKYIRCSRYRYRFATPAEKQHTGSHWVRTYWDTFLLVNTAHPQIPAQPLFIKHHPQIDWYLKFMQNFGYQGNKVLPKH